MATTQVTTTPLMRISLILEVAMKARYTHRELKLSQSNQSLIDLPSEIQGESWHSEAAEDSERRTEHSGKGEIMQRRHVQELFKCALDGFCPLFKSILVTPEHQRQLRRQAAENLEKTIVDLFHEEQRTGRGWFDEGEHTTSPQKELHIEKRVKLNERLKKDTRRAPNGKRSRDHDVGVK
ncbi:hypothetical protein FISHEDRAFT_61187 [Fistulina hepatica ATCC 64428]|uniref:Uncharacterized protein n=1 Tax=Fistulina hepatica ATCC 64428 TaxID=1128425 RepID=A0A0D7A378_9AGAR|nr:hypothetical protein FISHEDRAFT_61187 [Fistulina hepatica ATCC 64428]